MFRKRPQKINNHHTRQTPKRAGAAARTQRVLGGLDAVALFGLAGAVGPDGLSPVGEGYHTGDLVVGPVDQAIDHALKSRKGGREIVGQRRGELWQ